MQQPNQTMKTSTTSSRTLLVLLGALTALALNTSAAVINFTAAGGYTNGNLNGQSSWSGSIAVQVNTNGGGSATLPASAGAYASIAYSLGANALYSGYAGAVNFSLTLGSNNAASTYTITEFRMLDSATGNNGPDIQIKATSGGGFQWSIYNTLSGQTTANSLSGTGMGLAAAGTNTTAPLSLGFTTAFAGNTLAGSNIWRTTVTLSNLTTSASLGTLSQTWTNTTGCDTLSFNDAAMPTVCGTNGSIIVTKFAFGPIPSTWVYFTAAGGYTNGNLSGQSSWSGSTAWQVNTNSGGSAAISAASGTYLGATYGLGVNAFLHGYEGLFDFSFTLGTNINSGFNQFANFGLQDSANGNKGPNFQIKAAGAGFQFTLYNSVNSTFPTVGLSGAGMGLSTNSTGAYQGTTAALRLVVTNTFVGLDASGFNIWTTVGVLVNVSSNTSLASIAQTWTNTTGLGVLDKLEFDDENLPAVCGANGSLTVSDMAFAPMPVSAINFTTAGGYTNGNLNGQAGWSGSVPGWTADGIGNATITSAVLATYVNATYAFGSANALTNGYSGSFIVAYTLGAETTSGNSIFDFQLVDSANGNKGPVIQFKPFGSGVALTLYNSVDGSFTTVNIAATGMGLSGSGTGSTAPLKVNFTTTFAGTNASGFNVWNTVVTLVNVTTSARLGTVSQTWTNTTGTGRLDKITLDDGLLTNVLNGAAGSVSVSQITFGPLGASLGSVLPPSGGTTTTVLSIQNLGSGQFTLQWANGGTLQETTNLMTGAWLPVAGATSPYTNSLTGEQSFYRIHP